MMETSQHSITLPDKTDFENDSRPLGPDFAGSDPLGHTMAFTSYYLAIDGRPTLMVMGEFLFERVDSWQWRDDLIKLKMGGVNVISTYVYWNLHQPQEDQWINRGRMDVRRFADLCKELGLYLIIRIGPYVHSEIRNGGLPDWLYGKPYRVRESDQGFLDAVECYFQHLGRELDGMMYGQGGPIIGCQVDNEYGHSSSPWEMTREMGDEWVNMGTGGDQYMKDLRRIAERAGFVVPFYTATAWGGAVTTKRALPMWGGYAYRPWLFFQPWMQKGSQHPATQEYLYRNFHSDESVAQSSYDLFDPHYRPETMPYVCCEIGAGMFNSYTYRFVVDPKSVDALANVKLASGCNFLGYYLYRGGTDPLIDGQYMNETQTPHIEYDFQAPIGQWGQIRYSYRRLKAIHFFVRSFGSDLCRMHTILPSEANNLHPEDTLTLRYAVRARGNSGFLFINNFQDHAQSQDKSQQDIDILIPGREEGHDTIQFRDLGLQTGENCILPFNMDCDGALVRHATLQPLLRLMVEGIPTYVFFRPEGMTSASLFFENDVVSFSDGESCRMFYRFGKAGQRVRFLLLSRALADSLYPVWDFRPGAGADDRVLFFSSEAVLQDEYGIRLESCKASTTLLVYPRIPLTAANARIHAGCQEDVLGRFDCSLTSPDSTIRVSKVDKNKWVLWLNIESCVGLKNVLLNIKYLGDVGQAFIDGVLIHDNFNNGQTWQIGLHEYKEQLKKFPLVIVVIPQKENVTIDVDSPMAARHEQTAESRAELLSAALSYVYETRVSPLMPSEEKARS